MTPLILLATLLFGSSVIGAQVADNYPGAYPQGPVPQSPYFDKPYPNRPYPNDDIQPNSAKFVVKPKSFVDFIDSKLNEIDTNANAASPESVPNKKAKIYNYYTETGPYQVDSSDPAIRQYRSDKMETTHYREDPVAPIHPYYHSYYHPFYSVPQPYGPYPYFPQAPYALPRLPYKAPTVPSPGNRPINPQFFNNFYRPPQQQQQQQQQQPPSQDQDDIPMYPVNPHILPPPHGNSPFPYPYPVPNPRFFVNSL